uniref:RELT TNF receptor n=1 Tax=Meleagris gallopavo TaxID=9103 RepID=G3UP91_MELGA
MRWWLLAVLGVLSSPCMGTTACELLRCPPGKEPIGTCSTAQSCRPCPPGSSSAGDAPCACMHGFYSPDGHREPQGRCLPCSAAPHGTPGCTGQRRARSVVAPEGPSGANGTWEAQPEEAAAAQSAVLAIVPVFCAMGLLGILVCNLLKKKGYHCTAHKEHELNTSGPSSIYQIEDANEDTIGVLVRLITEKKGCISCLSFPPPAATSSTCTQCMAQLPLQTPPAPDAARGSGPKCCHPPPPPKPPDPPARSPFSPLEGEHVELGGSHLSTPYPKVGWAHRVSLYRFRVSRIPEQKPGVGGDPLPTSTRPSWLKSTDSRPEVRDWGTRCGLGTTLGLGSRGSVGDQEWSLFGVFPGEITAMLCWDWEVLTLKPNEGTDGECSATEDMGTAIRPQASSSCSGALQHCENFNIN